jgi:hypothetical protein
MHRRRLLLAPKATDKELIVSVQEDNFDFITHKNSNNNIGHGSSPDMSTMATPSFLKSNNSNVSSVLAGEHYPTATALDAQPHDPYQKENQSTVFHFLRGNQRSVKLKHTPSTRRRPTLQFYDIVSTVSLIFMIYVLFETLKITLTLGSSSISGGRGEGLLQPEKDSLLPIKDDSHHRDTEPSFRILFDPSWIEDRPLGNGHRRLNRPFLLLRPMVVKTMQEYEEYETPNYGMLGFYSLDGASLFYRNINLREDEELYEAYRSKVVRVWDNWPPAKTKLARKYEPTEDLQDSIVGSRQPKVLPLSSGNSGNHDNRNESGTDDANESSDEENQEEEDEENNTESIRSCHRAGWQERSYPTCNTLHELVTHRPLPDIGGVSGISTSIRNHPMGNVVAGVEETAHTRTHCLQPYNVSNLGYVYETKTM